MPGTRSLKETLRKEPWQKGLAMWPERAWTLSICLSALEAGSAVGLVKAVERDNQIGSAAAPAPFLGLYDISRVFITLSKSNTF